MTDRELYALAHDDPARLLALVTGGTLSPPDLVFAAEAVGCKPGAVGELVGNRLVCHCEAKK